MCHRQKHGLRLKPDKRIEGFSPQTLKAYQLQSSLLIDYFKDVETALLDTNQLKEYLAISCKNPPSQSCIVFAL